MKKTKQTIGLITLFGLVLVLGYCADTALAQSPGGEQQVWVVKQGDLNSVPGIGNVSAGTVSWGVRPTGKPGVGCGLTSDGTNTNEIMLQLTDNGGFSGDPSCELWLRFPSLKNHYTFENVTITPFHCGNHPCEMRVLSLGTRESSSLDVSVKGTMRGTVFSNVRSIFRITPTLQGPVNFSPFVDQAKPDLVVSKIEKSLTVGSPGKCSVAVTMENFGDSEWIDRQNFAYDADPGEAVLITLVKDKLVCGSSSVTLNEFDPDFGMNSVNQPVTLSWPSCSFTGTATFTVTVDAGNRLLERDETTGKSKTVQLQCSPVSQPKP